MSTVDEHEIEILEIVGVDDEMLNGPTQPIEERRPRPEQDLRLAEVRALGRREGRRQVLRQLLNPLDSLESCVREDSDPETMAEGVRLALRGLWDVFRHHDLERIEGDGVAFDPHIHEAAETVYSPRVPGGTVIKVLRVGYLLGGELVRPALVRVAMAEPAERLLGEER